MKTKEQARKELELLLATPANKFVSDTGKILFGGFMAKHINEVEPSYLNYCLTKVVGFSKEYNKYNKK